MPREPLFEARDQRWTRWRNYILVALVENERGESIIRRLLPAVEELIAPPEMAGSCN